MFKGYVYSSYGRELVVEGSEDYCRGYLQAMAITNSGTHDVHYWVEDLQGNKIQEMTR